MINQENCLERAWNILVLIIRLQWRLTDLIILNKHPKAREHFIKYNSSPTLWSERKKYRQKSFTYIKKEFIKQFPSLPSNREPLLEDLINKRDMISHWYISLGLNYILYQPDLNRHDTESKLKWIRRSIDWKPWEETLFKLSFNDENYENMISAIKEFDEKLFPSLSKKIWLNYLKIR